MVDSSEVITNESSFEQRYYDEKKEEKWAPEIYMISNEGILTDFVPLITPSQSAQAKLLGLCYPPNASFLFAGYAGLKDKDRIIEDIKKQALINGSRIRASNRAASRVVKGRLCTIDFFCQRHKHYSIKTHQFNENCIQAIGTIIQKEHVSKSASGKPCNSLVHPTDENDTPTKKRRKYSIRPQEKDHCCPFGFTIFCAEKDNWWYLGYSAR